ncbi:hypothetical protein ICE98_03320 [Lactococcus lactis]|nr:hypothetical protein [Lactococcus lactis]
MHEKWKGKWDSLGRNSAAPVTGAFITMKAKEENVGNLIHIQGMAWQLLVGMMKSAMNVITKLLITHGLKVKKSESLMIIGTQLNNSKHTLKPYLRMTTTSGMLSIHGNEMMENILSVVLSLWKNSRRNS